MRIVFFGTPSFSAHILDRLISEGFEVVAVISKPDKPKGRNLHLEPTPVKAYLKEKHPDIPLYQPEKVSDMAFSPIIEQYNADLFVVVAYGEIIKQHILDMPKIGCINIHTSLLPKYRGAAPIQRAIMSGEVESGVTIMHMVKKMDAGDIITQVIVPISESMTFDELEASLLKVGSEALIHVIKEGSFPHFVQDEQKVTFAPKVELEECEIKWDRPASEVHNLIRGTNPEPGAWTRVKIKDEFKRLKIFKSEVVKEQGNPGQILLLNKKEIIVACKENAIRILELQLEGKKRVAAAQWIQGVRKEDLQF